MNSGWDSAKKELEFHVEELSLARTRPNGRLVCIFVTYVYLPDLIQNLWTHPRLREKRYQSSKVMGDLCIHCGGSCLIHSLAEACLWKDKSVENAKMERVKKMKEN